MPRKGNTQLFTYSLSSTKKQKKHPKFNLRHSRFGILQWSNTLAIDAVLIALCWQAVFASIFGQTLNVPAISVLGLSIWLTYCADRLLDVRKRPLEQLHSIRHRFAKRHAKTLWKTWGSVLAINLSIAFAGLTMNQLRNGTVLLSVCLLYTVLNQKLSDRFFPKELCVAVIYAAGVVIFLLPAPDIWLPCGILMLLCLINCLIISAREQQIDAAMQVRSIAQSMTRLPILLYIPSLYMLSLLETQWLIPFGSSLAALALVQICSNRLSTESFRVLADAALLVGPLLTLLFQIFLQG